MLNAYLILEDGQVFSGKSIGSAKEVICEIVFNTSMTGYTELLTDPSYAGQGVIMTYPLIGNYGVTERDNESARPWVEAFIAREFAPMGSNFRKEMEIDDYLKKYEIPGIYGVDTRALTKILREEGTMLGMVTTDENFVLADCVRRIKAYAPVRLVEKVSCTQKRLVTHKNKKVALLDVGAKENIIRSLGKRGLDVEVFPASTSAEEMIASNPDGIMLSNGPGDPKECQSIIAEIRKLYETDIPIFAICLGHQLMALATGADTYKLHYGHRGANHPVKDLKDGRVYISSQNHGYAVDAKTVNPQVAAVRFVNVNDGTVEGLEYVDKNIFTVQFHPEASPGPQDTAFLFDRFVRMMEAR